MIKRVDKSFYKISGILNSQFKRESDLNENFNYNKVVMILGCGGIGSHVAEIVGSMQDISSIILFDNQTIELSNLNRTAFFYENLRGYKVEEIAKIISSRNLGVSVYPVNEIFNGESLEDIRKHTKLLKLSKKMTVIDCRDEYYGDYNLFEKLNIPKPNFIRTAYDGMSITIDLDPEKHPVHGRGGYFTTPSHSIPARMAALLAVTFFVYERELREMHPEIIATPMTFNVSDVINFIFNGVQTYKEKEKSSESF